MEIPRVSHLFISCTNGCYKSAGAGGEITLGKMTPDLPGQSRKEPATSMIFPTICFNTGKETNHFPQMTEHLF